MKNLIDSYKHIKILYKDYWRSVASMVSEHYDTPEYDGVLFILNMHPWGIPEEFHYLKSEKRIIYYNLEHFEIGTTIYPLLYSNIITDWGVEEYWDFDYSNTLIIRQYIQIPIKFMPLRYTTRIINPYPIPEKFDYTIGIVGVISTSYHIHRAQIIEELGDLWAMDYKEGNDYIGDISFKLIMGHPIQDILQELNSCKFILDTLSHTKHKGSTQNQVRIFEHVILGHHVLTEHIDDSINYFEGCLTTFWYPNDDWDDRKDNWTYATDLFKVVKYTERQNFSDKYKEMTYLDKNYELYKEDIKLKTLKLQS